MSGVFSTVVGTRVGHGRRECVGGNQGRADGGLVLPKQFETFVGQDFEGLD